MNTATSDALEALANVHRRRMLVELAEENPHGEVPLASVGTMPGEHLTVEMTHNHLPKLEADGYVEWDRETETVVRGPRFDELEPLLALLDEDGTGLADGS